MKRVFLILLVGMGSVALGVAAFVYFGGVSKPVEEVVVVKKPVEEVVQPKEEEEPKEEKLVATVQNPSTPKSKITEKKPSKKAKDVIPNEHVLKFKNTADLQAFIAEAKKKGAEILGVLPSLNAVRIKTENEAQWKDLMASSPVAGEAFPNFSVAIPQNGLATIDPAYLPFKGDALKWLGIQDHSNWGQGVTVAVLDTGIQDHPVFDGKNITRLDMLQDPTGAQAAWAGHGTAVASIVGGLSGVSPAANLMSVRVLSNEGTGDAFTVAQGLIAAVDGGAQILSLSLGSYGDSSVLRQAVEYAQQKGSIIVAAVGNDGFGQVAYPASYPGVIGISSVDAAGRHLDFSNYGQQVSMAAPGYGIYAAWTDNQMVSFSGTSSSVPFVSGTLASLVSTMKTSDAVNVLKAYSDDLGAPGWDAEYGYGILDVGRVLNRDQPGIYDAGVWIYIVNSPSGISGAQLGVGVQNRGTEMLPLVQGTIKIGSETRPIAFYNLAVNKSVSQLIPIGTLASSGAIQVEATISTPGVSDANPGNNVARVTIQKVTK